MYNLYHHNTGRTEEKTQNKGRIFCFVAAIGGKELSERIGIIPDLLWLFLPTAKKDSEGDYHKVFNRENHVACFKNNYCLTFFNRV